MFIGHWAPAFAAAAIGPRAPGLGTLFIAGQLVDWGFFVLATVGIEKMRVDPGATEMVPFDLYHMPYTHSLLGTALWALAFAVLLFTWRRDAVKALIGGLVVLSHWPIDWLVHRPDLTLAGGAETMGLGLWNTPAIAIPLELALTIGAWWLWVARTKGPVLPPWILLGFLLLLQAFNWFGPPPATAGFGLCASALFAFGLAAALAWWVGGTRWHRREVGLAVASPVR